MYKGVTLNEFIGELQKLAAEHGDKELKSIGACSGKLFGMSSPYTLRLEGDENLYVPAFSKDIKVHSVSAAENGEMELIDRKALVDSLANCMDTWGRDLFIVRTDWSHAVHLKDSVLWTIKNLPAVQGKNGEDLVSRSLLIDTLNDPSASWTTGFLFSVERLRGQAERLVDNIVQVVKVQPAVPAQDKGLCGRDKGVVSQNSDLRMDLYHGDLRHVWARVGMTLEITPEEEKAIFEGDYMEGKAAVKQVVMAGRASLDGETYIPEECIESFDEEYGTKYRDREDECAYCLDGIYVKASEAPLNKTVSEIIADATKQSGASQERGSLDIGLDI